MVSMSVLVDDSFMVQTLRMKHFPVITKYLLWLLIISIILKACPSTSCLSQERIALLQLKDHLVSVSNSSSSEDLEPSWVEDGDCCTWERVQCDSTTQHVTGLSLSSWLPASTYVVNVSLFEPFRELITLDLSHNNIAGFVGFKGLCELKNLEELHLMENYISGNLPPCMGNMTSLRVLDISYNYLSGQLSPITSNLKSLESLSVSENSFSGEFSLNSFLNHSIVGALTLNNNHLHVKIDESLNLSNFHPILGLSNCNLNMQSKSFLRLLSQLWNLNILDISHNGLVGSFPGWLLQKSLIQVLILTNNSFGGVLGLPYSNGSLSLLLLDVSENHFSGSLPENIGAITPSLQFLNASNNNFQGKIPASFGNLTNLEVLEFSNNHFSGELSPIMFMHCSFLQFLKLSSNHLQGELSSLPFYNGSQTSELDVLHLDYNHFTGTIEDKLYKFISKLSDMDISHNEIAGGIPSWIGNFSYWILLSVSHNQLKGQIPTELCNMDHLMYLDLSNNELTGVIPSCFSYSNLFGLWLQNNFLSGSIPSALSGCSRLLAFDVSGNQLSGGIPLWIGNLSQLKILLLGHNSLGGEIPTTLCQVKQMNIMDLSNNDITGVIPSCLANITFGAFPVSEYIVSHTELAVSMIFPILENWYHRALDVPMSDQVVSLLTKSKYSDYRGSILLIMSMLDLSCNRLTGRIPKELGQLDKLHGLNLSHNELFGSIPSSFSMLKNMESLDLSYNNLSGAIPYELAQVTALEIFNVSYNNLSGTVPETGQFASFDETNYMGNPFLCGFVGKSCGTTSKNASRDGEDDDTSDGFDWQVFFWSFGMSSIVLFVCINVVLLINPQWRRAWFVFSDYYVLWWLVL